MGHPCTSILAPSPGAGVVSCSHGFQPSHLLPAAEPDILLEQRGSGPPSCQSPGAAAAATSKTARRGHVGTAGLSPGKTWATWCGSCVLISCFLPAALSSLGLSSCPLLAPGCPLTPPAGQASQIAPPPAPPCPPTAKFTPTVPPLPTSGHRLLDTAPTCCLPSSGVQLSPSFPFRQFLGLEIWESALFFTRLQPAPHMPCSPPNSACEHLQFIHLPHTPQPPPEFKPP